MSSAGTEAPRAARRRLALRARLATTPARLRLALALLALGSIAFGVIAATAAGTRREAVDRVAATESLLRRAVHVSASLSDAHEAAAFSFLVGGTEPARTRLGYSRQLRDAAAGLAAFAGEVGQAAGSRPAVRDIAERLPVYAGLIDSARANQRQGFPVAGAYLRRASTVMRTAMLPRAGKLYEIAARDLVAGYRSAGAASSWLAVLGAFVALLALLVATQVYVARTTRRFVNPPLALATVILCGLAAWVVAAFAFEQHHLALARSSGSDPVELLTATSILASRAQANESVALSSRGGGEGEQRLTDVDRGFQAAAGPIGTPLAASARESRGLLAALVTDTGHPTAPIDAIYAAYRRYRAAHDEVVRLERVGDFTRAVRLATAPAGSTTAAVDALDALLARETRVAQSRLREEVARAGAALDAVIAGILLLTPAIVLLALLGVRVRLVEYR